MNVPVARRPLGFKNNFEIKSTRTNEELQVIRIDWLQCACLYSEVQYAAYAIRHAGAYAVAYVAWILSLPPPSPRSPSSEKLK